MVTVIRQVVAVEPGSEVVRAVPAPAAELRAERRHQRPSRVRPPELAQAAELPDESQVDPYAITNQVLTQQGYVLPAPRRLGL